MRGVDTTWFTIVPATIAAVAPAPALATVYVSVDQARQAMFPGAHFVDRAIAFSPEQRKAVARASGGEAPDKVQHVWEARTQAGRAGWFLVDRVIGKHDYITYAVALSPDGAVKRVEILEYRESYGGEVRNPAWRQQFVGKRFGARLKVGADIRNISGATLSSTHVTEGVRRILAIHQLFLKNG